MFVLEETRYIEEIKSHCFLYRHPVGTRLLHIQNEDKNKVFFSAFPTPCENDKGIPHIVEHCVLAGSKRYPVKDPFHEMSKSAFHTYLNALTYSDKTVYPVASTSRQDFENLTKVYLDAVFCPLLRKETFLQEGWNRFPVQGGPGGIVYNEMSGVYSDPAEFLNTQGQKALFPNTLYRFDSGGVPEAILSLSYEDFLDFYRKRYNPAHCYLYFYGNLESMEIEEYCSYIHNTYLDSYPTCDEDKQSLFRREKSFDRRVVQTIEYPFPANPRQYLYVGRVMWPGRSFARLQGLRILQYYLLGTQASPIRRAILDTGLGQQVKYGFHDGGLQPYSKVIIHQGSDHIYSQGELSLLMEIEDKTFTGLHKGLDKDILEACIARFDFALRDHTGYKPKGLTLGIRVLEGWIHGETTLGELSGRISPLGVLEDLKKQGEAYFLQLLKEDFINNTHAAYLKLVPSQNEHNTFFFDNEGREEENQQLQAFQNKSDSPEELQTIPFIPISARMEEEPDIYTPEEIPLEEKNIGGMKVLFHPLDTENIIYMDIFFNTDNLPEYLLSGIHMLTYVLGKLATEKFDVRELSRILSCYFGGFSVSFEVFQGSLTYYHPKITIKVKCLSGYLPEVLNSLKEILLNTLFQEDELHKLLLELSSKLRNQAVNEGQHTALTRLMSYFGQGGLYKEKTYGIDFYYFLRNSLVSGDKKKNREYLREVTRASITRENMIINLTCGQEDYDHFKEEFHRFYKGFPTRQKSEGFLALNESRRDEALITATKVQYVTAAWDFRDICYSGTMALAVHILNTAFLTEQVRINGGAYGCHCHFLQMGLLYFYSYRDPHLKRTLEVYEKAFSFLCNFHSKEWEMDKYKIGALNPYLRPQSNEGKGRLSATRYFMDITQEALERRKKEILEAEASDIRRLGVLMSEQAGRHYICVNGSEKAIQECRGLFSEVKIVE